jgi:hypothetical protein
MIYFRTLEKHKAGTFGAFTATECKDVLLHDQPCENRVVINVSETVSASIIRVDVASTVKQ